MSRLPHPTHDRYGIPHTGPLPELDYAYIVRPNIMFGSRMLTGWLTSSRRLKRVWVQDPLLDPMKPDPVPELNQQAREAQERLARALGRSVSDMQTTVPRPRRAGHELVEVIRRQNLVTGLSEAQLSNELASYVAAIRQELADERADEAAADEATRYALRRLGGIVPESRLDDIDTGELGALEIRAMADHVAEGGSLVFAENTPQRELLQPWFDRFLASWTRVAYELRGAPPIPPEAT